MSDNRLVLTWPGVVQLIQSMDHVTRPGAFDRIVCVSRGGLAVGGLIANLWDVRKVGVLCVEGYAGESRNAFAKVLQAPPVEEFNVRSTLFVDDIVDTGRTMELVARAYPAAWRYALVGKPSGLDAAHTVSMTVEQEMWVEFPWEVKRGTLSTSLGEIGERPQ